MDKNNITKTEESVALHRTRRSFLVDHLATTAIFNLCGGIYLAGLLRFMGFSDAANGTILAIPVLGGLFQIVGPIILSKTKEEQPFLVYGTFLGRLCLSLVFFIPILLGGTGIGGALVVLIYSMGHCILSMLAPAMGNWVMLVTPPRDRSSFFALRERLGLGSMAVAMLIASALLDILASPQQRPIGFMIIGIVLVLFCVVDLYALKRMHKPNADRLAGLTLKEMVKMLATHDIAKVMGLTVLWHLATQIWIPHNSIYVIETLGISYSFLGVMSTVTSVQKILLMVLWARYTSRNSFEHSFFSSIFIFALSNAVYLVMTPENAMVMMVVQNIISATAWAIMGVALFNVQYDNLTGQQKVLKMGIIGGISGVLGFIVSIIGGNIIDAVDTAGGLIGFDGQQVVISIACVACVGIMMLLYYGFIPKDKRPKIKDYTDLLAIIVSRIKTLIKDKANKRKYRSERWIH